MFGISDCIADRIRLGISQATEWQRIGDWIDAAMIFAGPDFVNMHWEPVGPLANSGLDHSSFIGSPFPALRLRDRLLTLIAATGSGTLCARMKS
jgi:hypothetical protein